MSHALAQITRSASSASLDGPSTIHCAAETGARRPKHDVTAVLQTVAGRVAITVLNAATGIVAARALAPAGRGELSAILIWPIMLSSALTLGIPSALTFHLNRNTRNKGMLIASAVVLCVVANILAAAIASLFVPLALHLYSPAVQLYARVFLVFAPIGILQVVCRAALEAEGDFATSSSAQSLIPLLTLIGLLALWWTHRMTPETAAYAYVVNAIPINLWMLIKVWHDYRPVFAGLWGSARILFSYGARSYGIDLCGTLSLYVNQALVVGMLSPGTMGKYVVVLSLSRVLSIFQNSVVAVLFPKAIGRAPEDIVELTGKAARVSMVCAALAGILILIFGRTALLMLYGSAYAGVAPILRILIVEVILGGLTMVLAQAAMALGKPGIVTLLQTFGLALTVPLMLILIPRWGIMGAACSLLISTCCRLLFIVVSFPRFLGLRCPRIWVDGSDFPVMLTYAAQVWRIASATKS